MKLEASIDKRYFLVVLGIMFLLAGGFVYAYGTSTPATFGHTAEEISGSLTLSDCYWTDSGRCSSCTKTWSCGTGEVVNAIKHKSTGETHVDYVWVQCCKIGF